MATISGGDSVHAQPYLRCHCHRCEWFYNRHGERREIKREAHRAYRRAERTAVRRGDEPPAGVYIPAKVHGIAHMGKEQQRPTLH